MQPGHQAEIDQAHELGAVQAHGATSEEVRTQAAGLVRDGRMDEAAAVLAHGSGLFPDDVHLLLDHASLAEALEDRDGAIALLRTAIDRHPGMPDAYLRAGALHRKAGRPHQAETILLEGMCWCPSSIDMVAEYAAVAEDREDWGQAARRHRLARERFPTHAGAHARLASALRKAERPLEAEQALLQGQQHVPHDAHFAIEYAELAAEREDWTEAARRFETARERFPHFGRPCKRAADMLKRAGRVAEAEALLLDGQRTFPGERDLFLDHAELAAERQDWTEALRRFGLLQERFPDFWWSWKRAADTLRAAGRTGEAETVLLDGQRRHPQEAGLFLDHAELAAAAKDWAETVRRFEIARDRFPAMWWPWRRIVQTLREMERFDEAERVVLAGAEVFPDDPALFFDHADLLQRTDRAEEALERYRFIQERFPDSFWGYFLLSRSLMAINRLGEAESMLIKTMEVFPDEPGSLIELVHMTGRIPAESRQLSLPVLEELVSASIRKHGETLDLLGAQAQLAQLNGDYADYMRQLVRILERYPDARNVVANMAIAREILLGNGEPVPGESAVPPAEPGDMPTTPQELVGCFESLGGGGPDGATIMGCEFGFLQRELKIEPLSLLRWTGVTLPNLTRLLVNDFRDVGKPETTVLTSVEAYFDWHVVDTMYDLHCDHSHLDRLTVPREQAQRMMCQRTTFLVRKLREDLDSGKKIFVYRYSGRLEDEAAVLALADAVNRFGRTMLFFVCRADEHHAPLTVRPIHPGLVVGYIDWFSIDRLGFPVNVDGWLTLCAAAYRLWRKPSEAI